MKWILVLIAVIAAVPAFLLKTALAERSQRLPRKSKIKICLGTMAACIVAGSLSARFLAGSGMSEHLRTALIGVVLISFFTTIGTIVVLNDFLKEPK